MQEDEDDFFGEEFDDDPQPEDDEYDYYDEDYNMNREGGRFEAEIKKRREKKRL